MEALPLLIFLVIAFNIFRGFTKTAGKAASKTARDNMVQRLKEAQAAQNQNIQNEDWSFGKPNTSKRKGHEKSPWGDNGSVAPGARVAANYLKNKQLKKSRAARKASHKNPVQHGRRGQNMDQNRHRTDDWGQRGDSGPFSGKMAIILLVIGAGLLYGLSQIPAS